MKLLVLIFTFICQAPLYHATSSKLQAFIDANPWAPSVTVDWRSRSPNSPAKLHAFLERLATSERESSDEAEPEAEPTDDHDDRRLKSKLQAFIDANPQPTDRVQGFPSPAPTNTKLRAFLEKLAAGLSKGHVGSSVGSSRGDVEPVDFGGVAVATDELDRADGLELADIDQAVERLRFAAKFSRDSLEAAMVEPASVEPVNVTINPFTKQPFMEPTPVDFTINPFTKQPFMKPSREAQPSAEADKLDHAGFWLTKSNPLTTIFEADEIEPADEIEGTANEVDQADEIESSDDKLPRADDIDEIDHVDDNSNEDGCRWSYVPTFSTSRRRWVSMERPFSFFNFLGCSGETAVDFD